MTQVAWWISFLGVKSKIFCNLSMLILCLKLTQMFLALRTLLETVFFMWGCVATHWSHCQCWPLSITTLKPPGAVVGHGSTWWNVANNHALKWTADLLESHSRVIRLSYCFWNQQILKVKKWRQFPYFFTSKIFFSSIVNVSEEMCLWLNYSLQVQFSFWHEASFSTEWIYTLNEGSCRWDWPTKHTPLQVVIFECIFTVMWRIH